MTVSDFRSFFFLGIIFWKKASLFNEGEGYFLGGGRASFLSGWAPHGGGIGFDEGVEKRIVGWRGHTLMPPTMGNPVYLPSVFMAG